MENVRNLNGNLIIKKVAKHNPKDVVLEDILGLYEVAY